MSCEDRTRDSFFNLPTKSSEQRRRSQKGKLKEKEGKLWQDGQGRGFQDEMCQNLLAEVPSDSLAFLEQREFSTHLLRIDLVLWNYPS